MRESSAADAASATSAEFMCILRALHTLSMASTSEAIFTLFSVEKNTFFRTYTQHLHFVHSFCCKIFKLGNIYCFHSNYDIKNSYFDAFVVKSISE